MNKLLIAIRKTVKAGNMVIFGGDSETIRKLAYAGNIEENMIVNKKTMAKSKIKDKDGVISFKFKPP